MKKSILMFVIVAWSMVSFGMSHAHAGQPLTGLTKEVPMAGSGGLDAAATKCAHLVGTNEWQACVAHHDGLYTLNNDGSIRRSYVRDEAAPKPHGAGAVVCKAGGFVNKNGQIVWAVQENTTCRIDK